MSFSFSKFTPSVAGETTGEILEIIAYLAQLRTQNNEIAADNFDISSKAAAANANRHPPGFVCAAVSTCPRTK